MKITNNKNRPEEFIKAIKFYQPKPERMSTTHLIDEPLIRTLQIEKWDDIIVDVSDFTLMLLGISFHKYIGEFGDEFAEHKFEDKVDSLMVVGKADLYKVETQSIEDWKVTSVWTLVYESRVKEWEKQLNVYAWQHRKRGLKVTKLVVHAILRDWSESRALKNKDYPQNDFVSIEIPLWSFEQQEKYIKDQIQFHLMNPKGECSPESKWQKETAYAVMKKGRKSALRVFDEEVKAIDYQVGYNKSTYIEKRLGECLRCKKYCLVRSVCEYAKGDK